MAGNSSGKQLMVGILAIAAIIVVGSVAVVTRVAEIARQQQAPTTPPVTAGNFELGGTLPDITFQPLGEGEPLRLSSLLDGSRFVVINFHHPDCPCAENCGRLVADMMKEGAEDLSIIGILAAGENDQRVLRALNRQREEGIITFPVYTDADRSLRELFGATRTPEIWLLDKGGRIAYYGAPESTLFPGAEDHRFLLREAVEALRRGEEPEFRTFMPIGCPMDD